MDGAVQRRRRTKTPSMHISKKKMFYLDLAELSVNTLNSSVIILVFQQIIKGNELNIMLQRRDCCCHGTKTHNHIERLWSCVSLILVHHQSSQSAVVNLTVRSN